jgi:hypothetical protein
MMFFMKTIQKPKKLMIWIEANYWRCDTFFMQTRALSLTNYLAGILNFFRSTEMFKIPREYNCSKVSKSTRIQLQESYKIYVNTTAGKFQNLREYNCRKVTKSTWIQLLESFEIHVNTTAGKLQNLREYNCSIISKPTWIQLHESYKTHVNTTAWKLQNPREYNCRKLSKSTWIQLQDNFKIHVNTTAEKFQRKSAGNSKFWQLFWTLIRKPTVSKKVPRRESLKRN